MFWHMCHTVWHHILLVPVRATGNSHFENAKFPLPNEKFPFGKMLDFARSNTISTQTSNTYLNQLQ